MKARGFTLIEILIVMVIISIVATSALLTVHFNRNKQLEDFSNQLTDLISLAENDALLRATSIGIALSSHAIQFYTWDEKNNHWQKNTVRVFRDKNFLTDMQVTLKIQNETVPADGTPHLIITPNGDLPAFTFLIGNKNNVPRYRVIGEESGQVYAK